MCPCLDFLCARPGLCCRNQRHVTLGHWRGVCTGHFEDGVQLTQKGCQRVDQVLKEVLMILDR